MSSTPLRLPTQANRPQEPSFNLPGLPQELRFMIWKASILPRIVPLMVKVETPECRHVLRTVRSNAIVTSRCEGPEEHYTTRNNPLSEPPIPVANNPCTFPDTPEDRKLDRIIHKARTAIIHDWRYNPRFAWVSNLPAPPLLHVCRESRLFGMQYYTLSFATKHYPPTTYFNFQLDTLYFAEDGANRRNETYLKCFDRGAWPLLECISPSEQLQIRKVAIQTCILKHWEKSTPRLQRTLSQIQKSYRNVDTVFVIVEDFTDLYDGRKPGGYSKADSLAFLPPDNIPLKLYSFDNPHWHKKHHSREIADPPDGVLFTIPPKSSFRRLDVFFYSTQLESTSSEESSEENPDLVNYIPLPDVEYRVLSTQHMKMRLEKARREYEEWYNTCQCYEADKEAAAHEPRNQFEDTYVIWKPL